LSRNLLQCGKLQHLIDTRSVVGVTTNPSTFERALTHGRAYDGQIAELTACGTDVDTAIRTVITDDVRAVCDVFCSRENSVGKR
jgi:transaldolase